MDGCPDLRVFEGVLQSGQTPSDYNTRQSLTREAPGLIQTLLQGMNAVELQELSRVATLRLHSLHLTDPARRTYHLRPDIDLQVGKTSIRGGRIGSEQPAGGSGLKVKSTVQVSPQRATNVYKKDNVTNSSIEQEVMDGVKAFRSQRQLSSPSILRNKRKVGPIQVSVKRQRHAVSRGHEAVSPSFKLDGWKSAKKEGTLPKNRRRSSFVPDYGRQTEDQCGLSEIKRVQQALAPKQYHSLQPYFPVILGAVGLCLMLIIYLY